VSDVSNSAPFCFLIPVQSKQVSRNWSTIVRLLDLTLQSIFRQTSGNFRVLVACHEIPELPTKFDDRLRFVPVDFAPPSPTAPTSERMQDKWDKLAVLMCELRRMERSHMMIVDADDLVSRRIVEYCQQNPTANGWMIKTGYRYAVGSRMIVLMPGTFTCGTDSILNASKIRFPQSRSPEEIQQCLPLVAGHTVIGEMMAKHGMALETLPFPGAVYMTNHGENDSHLGRESFFRKMLRRSHWKLVRELSRQGSWKRLSPAIREEFGMPTPSEMKSICLSR
jgi:hypothetical protein